MDATHTSRQIREKRTAGYYVSRILIGFFLIVFALSCLMPFVWMLSASLKLNKDVFEYPIRWIPHPIRWRNYSIIWKQIPLLTFFYNTFKLSIIITFLQVLTSSFAAYAFAKLRFPGRNLLFMLYLGTIAIPWQCYMIPQYIMMTNWHLTNTHLSIILLQTFTAFGVFLMRQAYISIPNELMEAARIDGLNEYGIYARIMVPLIKPALATLTIFTFVATWNDYMGPLIYFNDTQLKTIQLGIRMFIQQYSADYNLLMAASVCSLIPVVLLFSAMQNFFIEGIATTGLKG